MQKKIIAVAIAGLASSAAFADASNVTLYGRMDYGFLSQSGGSGGYADPANGTRDSFAAGIAAGSRIGLRGAEDLGNGLKAVFETEFGIGNDQVGNGASVGTTTIGITPNTTTISGTTAYWTNRHSYVGLAGGFGTVVGGRLDGVRYGIFNKYDAFAGGTFGNFTQMTNQVDRADNAIAYISPDLSGFKITAAYATTIAGQEAAGNTGDLKLNTIELNYSNGPIAVDVDYETIKSNKDAGATTTDIKTSLIGASYDFGVAKVGAVYDTIKNDGITSPYDYHDWFISAKAPLTASVNLKLTYGKVLNKKVGITDGDSQKTGVGIDYKLSKRTLVYVNYGTISNGSQATNSISYAANAGKTPGTPLTSASAYGTKGFDIGVAHNF